MVFIHTTTVNKRGATQVRRINMTVPAVTSPEYILDEAKRQALTYKGVTRVSVEEIQKWWEGASWAQEGRTLWTWEA